MGVKLVKAFLWLNCISCLIVILNAIDGYTFNMAGFYGFVNAWILFRWNKYGTNVERFFHNE